MTNYDENGRGITIHDIRYEFGISKKVAQRKIKHLMKRKVIFTALDLEKEGIIIRGIKERIRRDTILVNTNQRYGKELETMYQKIPRSIWTL